MRTILLGVVFTLLFAFAANAASLVPDKSLYKVGETIRVSYTDPGGHSGAWIGLFDASVPTDAYTDADAYDQAYQYTSGAKSGVVEFKAANPGFFQVRFFNEDTSPDVPVASSATFEISTEGGRIGQPSVSFDKPIYARGAKIKLSYTWNPSLPTGEWVGLFRNGSPLDGSENPDDYDVNYQYISEQTSGTWVFDAPSEVGFYTAAIISGDRNQWEPYCTVRMQVTLDGKTPLPMADDRHPIAVSSIKLRAGDEIIVAYKVPFGLKNPWIALVPASCTSDNDQDNDNVDVNYTYVKSGEEWYWTFHVPSDIGGYVLRLFPDTDGASYAVDKGVYFQVVPRS